jgi:hypothetical protein
VYWGKYNIESTTLVSKEKENTAMENEFMYQELSDEQLELVVGGDGVSFSNFSQVAVAANVAIANGIAQQNANATNQAGANFNATAQANVIKF